MKYMNQLYAYLDSSATFNVHSLVPDAAWIIAGHTLNNGGSIWVVYPKSASARKKLEAEAGVTVLPPLHRPLQSNHLSLLSYVGAIAGDTTYDVAEKLFRHHVEPYFHPEEGPFSHSSMADLT